MGNIFEKLNPKIAHKPFKPKWQNKYIYHEHRSVGSPLAFREYWIYLLILFFSCFFVFFFHLFILHTFISLIFQLLFLLRCIPDLLCDFSFSYASQFSHNLQITHATSSFNLSVMSSSVCFDFITWERKRDERWLDIITICSIAFTQKKKKQYQHFPSCGFWMHLIINRRRKQFNKNNKSHFFFAALLDRKC